MTNHALPAHLQNRQVQDFTDYADAGLGTMLPPHVSIQGNQFTLIDATGQEFQPMPVMDVVIVDRSTVTCKMYFGKEWVLGSEDPPLCWSSNGIGPSRDAAVPQARTCAECDKNVRGSAVSKLSGAAIKACRDEYHMAILLPSMSTMMFRYVLTPGSFENWQGYVAKFKNSNVKISMVLTRMAFQPKTNGVVTFESVNYIDEVTNNIVLKALAEKATDALCGRLDQPRTAALPPPQGYGAITQITVAPNTTSVNVASDAPIERPQVQQPGPFVPTPAANVAAPGLSAPNPVQPAATTSPSELAPAGRRRRRTAAEMQAANGPAPSGQPMPAPAAAPQAPFPHAATAQPAPQFGIAQGQEVAANPELSGMLDDFFGKGQ